MFNFNFHFFFFQREIAPHLIYTVGKVSIGVIDKTIDKLINNTKKQVPYAMRQGASPSETSMMKKHIIRFNCPSTKNVRNIRNQQGSQKIYLYSTISQSINKIERELNYVKFGFNQKSILFLNSYVTLKDYAEEYKINTFKYPKDSKVVPYGMSFYEFSQLKVLNSDSYNSMEVKVHLLEITSNKYSQENVSTKTFNKDLDKQQNGAIPINYQLKPLQISSIMHRMLVTPKCSIGSSQFFKNNVKIVKTFHKRLEPGDVLDFQLKVNCGPGVRLDLLKEMIEDTLGEQPSSYSIMLEVSGYDCEAVRLSDGCKFIGTSPGWYTIEYDKGFELGLQNNSLSVSEVEESLESSDLMR